VLRVVSRQLVIAPVRWSGASPVARWRRALTVALGVLWLLDASLQFQPYMFTAAFPDRVIAPAAAGSPAWVAGPVRWTARLIAHNVVLFDGLFASAQLLIAVGLFLAVTVRIALAASVVWSLSVWWLGEAFGGTLAGPVSPLTGVPGAVVIYALIAVLLWPPRPRPARPGRLSVASTGLLGPLGAQLVWFALWLAFAYEAIRPANLRANGLADSIRAMTSGEPTWLATMNRFLAGGLASHGTQYALGLAALCILLAISVFVPALTRAGIVIAVALALAIWILAQDLGEIATGTATDPNTGLPLTLLALCYWPLHSGAPQPTSELS
jgi:hypothetical protein